MASAAWVISPTRNAPVGKAVTWMDTLTWTRTVTHTGDYGETISAYASGAVQAGSSTAAFTVHLYINKIGGK